MKPFRVRWHSGLLAALLLAAFARLVLGAPDDENWDATFGVPGVLAPGNPRVYAICVMGKDVYVAGLFSQIGGLSTTNIARWDGTNWHGLGPGLGSLADERGVSTLLAAQGQLYAGGFFTNAGNAPIAWLAKWDGREWALIGPVNGPVRALASDGSNLYVGGAFTAIGGITASNVARWDGSNWSPLGDGVHRWQTGIVGGPTDLGQVFALAVRGGEVFVGGEFEIAGTLKATNIARWNGTGWSPVDGALFLVRSLVGDAACVYAGTDAGIRCWDGIGWRNPGGGVSAPGYVTALVRSGADLYVGGQFSLAGGVPAMGIAKWDGARWSALGSGLENPGQLGAAATVLAATGSELFVGGIFTVAGGKPATNIARWRIPHALKINRASNDALLSWPATGSNLALESTACLGSIGWSNVPNPVAIHERECLVTNEISGFSRVYRLWGR